MRSLRKQYSRLYTYLRGWPLPCQKIYQSLLSLEFATTIHVDIHCTPYSMHPKIAKVYQSGQVELKHTYIWSTPWHNLFIYRVLSVSTNLYSPHFHAFHNNFFETMRDLQSLSIFGLLNTVLIEARQFIVTLSGGLWSQHFRMLDIAKTWVKYHLGQLVIPGIN